jgi:hypothetical protein
VYPHLSVLFLFWNHVADFLNKLNPQQGDAIDHPPTRDQLIAQITPGNLHKRGMAQSVMKHGEYWD